MTQTVVTKRAPGIQFRAIVDGVPLESSTQSEFVVFIALYMAERKHSPCFREIMKGVGLASLLSVTRHMKALRDRGILDWTEGRARSIRFLKDVKLEIIGGSDNEKN